MRSVLLLLVVLGLLLATGCATTGARLGSVTERTEEGFASYYARRFHGRPTASGQRYDERDFTAAHRTLPFGARVRVTNLHNDRSVVVEITDRGPFRRGRVIDLSRRAARELDFVRDGIAWVRLEVLGP